MDLQNDARSSPERPRAPLRRRCIDPSDLRGTAQLASEATMETTRIVEAAHAGVLNALRVGSSSKPAQTRGLTGWIYRTIRRIIRLSEWGTTTALRVAERARTEPTGPIETRTRDRLISTLNGVFGDHLRASGNPLARSFSLRTVAREPVAEDIGDAGPLVVFVHGLCCSDRDWIEREDEVGHVAALADAVDGTAVLARYNTGLAIWENGQNFSEQLDALVSRAKSAPRIVLVTHSMGGLVTRSAYHHAAATSARWVDHVTETIYMGTPHRGAPLERAGVWVENLLRRTPFTLPMATLGSARSQGIQDLGHGAILPDAAASDGAEPVSTSQDPGRVLYVAGTLARKQLLVDTVGDGLVPVDSALNAPDPSHATRKVFEKTGHLKLLRDPAVTAYLSDWLMDKMRDGG